MKLAKEYVLYENSGEYFNSYTEAYWHSKLSKIKKVNYVFTPTMQICPRVNVLYKVARDYFRKCFNCDYLDPVSHCKYEQLSLLQQV